MTKQTKSKWRKVEWRHIWLDHSARQELMESAEYAPDKGVIKVDRLEVPVEGLKERIEKLDRERLKGDGIQRQDREGMG